jgi:beta-N-acetylhexosaminidase
MHVISRRRAALLATAAATAAGAVTTASAATAASPTPPATAAAPATTRLLGQRIMVGLPGTTASPALLRQIRAGQVGSVILFAYNIASRRQVLALDGSLQQAARQGGNPPLLIAVDQEGGEVKRFPGGPPTLSPPQIAATGQVSTAAAQGRSTGRYLAGLGINMELAPVSDVPTSRSAFIWQQGRAFSFSPTAVASYATAFAVGVQSARVAATAKHFPGLGTAPIDTDNQLQILHPTAGQRAGALTPYRLLIAHRLDAIMVTTAAFPAYDASDAPAAMSSKIVGGLLRGQLHFDGVTISDSLDVPVGHDPITAGVLAARAGTDILLYTDDAAGELTALTRALARGQVTPAAAQASYNRVVALKRRLVVAR